MVGTYIVGGILILAAVTIFVYNLKRPTDDFIPSREQAIRESKVVWGFWHTGENAKKLLRYGTVQRILLLEPNEANQSFCYRMTEARATKTDLITNVRLTTAAAQALEIPVKYHNELTALSFMICDPSPDIECSDSVSFSKRAYVVAQVMDRNLVTSEWPRYKVTKAGNPHAFRDYEHWFKDVWDNKSGTAMAVEGTHDFD